MVLLGFEFWWVVWWVFWVLGGFGLWFCVGLMLLEFGGVIWLRILGGLGFVDFMSLCYFGRWIDF